MLYLHYASRSQSAPQIKVLVAAHYSINKLLLYFSLILSLPSDEVAKILLLVLMLFIYLCIYLFCLFKRPYFPAIKFWISRIKLKALVK